MAVILSPHAKERLVERSNLLPVSRFLDLVRDKVEQRDWQEWWEYDQREGRGVRLNRLVFIPEAQAWALLRQPEDDVYVVASVLTQKQYAFNAENLWHRDRAKAVPPNRTITRPLTHNPFREKLR